jgi:hypothetical protein
MTVVLVGVLASSPRIEIATTTFDGRVKFYIVLANFVMLSLL